MSKKQAHADLLEKIATGCSYLEYNGLEVTQRTPADDLGRLQLIITPINVDIVRVTELGLPASSYHDNKRYGISRAIYIVIAALFMATLVTAAPSSYSI